MAIWEPYVHELLFRDFLVDLSCVSEIFVKLRQQDSSFRAPMQQASTLKVQTRPTS